MLMKLFGGPLACPLIYSLAHSYVQYSKVPCLLPPGSALPTILSPSGPQTRDTATAVLKIVAFLKAETLKEGDICHFRENWAECYYFKTYFHIKDVPVST